MSQFRAVVTRIPSKPINGVMVFHDFNNCILHCRQNGDPECDYHGYVEKISRGDGIALLQLPMSRLNHYISAVYGGQRLDERGVREFGGQNYAVDLSFP